MLTNFKEIEEYVLNQKSKKIVALSGAHDDPALSAVINARKKGIIDALLIGKEQEIITLLNKYNEKIEDYKIINIENDEDIAATAIRLVREGKADIPMKGIMQTSTFMKAILNKQTGITTPGNLISHVAITEHPDYNRFIIFGDCAINIAPKTEDKVKIMQNMKPLTNALGIETPKVAILSAVEKVSPKIQSTLDAQEIKEMQIQDFLVDGPLAFDGAISLEASKHKGIEQNVAGNADLLIVPNLESGNILYKSITYIAKRVVAGIVMGANHPIVMTSRADSSISKYYSILLAALVSHSYK